MRVRIAGVIISRVLLAIFVVAACRFAYSFVSNFFDLQDFKNGEDKYAEAWRSDSSSGMYELFMAIDAGVVVICVVLIFALIARIERLKYLKDQSK